MKKEDKLLHIRVSGETHRKLKVQAALEGKSLQRYLVPLIAQHVDSVQLPLGYKQVMNNKQGCCRD